MSSILTKRLARATIVAATFTAAGCSGSGQSASLPIASDGLAQSAAQQTSTMSTATGRATFASSAQGASAPLAYKSAVLADAPSAFLSLSDTGSNAVNAMSATSSGLYGSAVSHGKALNSDGTASAQFSGGVFNISHVITFAPNASFAPAATISTDFWIELTQPNSSSTVTPILSYGSGSHDSMVPYSIQLTPRNTLKWSIRGGAPYYTWGFEETAVLVVGKPYHVAATYDGTTEHMYVNGVQTLNVKAPGPLTYGNVAAGTAGLTIGGEIASLWGVPSALISDVAIYPTVLSQAAIARHYAAGTIVATAAPTAPPALPSAAPVPTAIPNAVTEMPKSVFSFEDSVGFDSHFNYTNSPYWSHKSQDMALIEQLPAHHLRDGSLDELPILTSFCQAGVHHSVMFPVNVTPAQITAQLNQFGPACVDYVEPLNEYDGSGDPNWAANIMAEQRVIWATMKANPAFANIVVLGPGLSSAAHYALIPGADQISDAASIHDGQCDGSPLTTHYKNAAQSLAEIKAVYSKPVWSTEIAVFNDPSQSACGVTLPVAAKYIPRQLLVRYNLGMPRNYYNEFSEFPAINVWGTLGIVDPNANPYPAYTALHSLFAALPTGQMPQVSLGQLNYALTGSTANVNHTLLQGNNGTYYMVVWAEVDSWDVKRKVALTPAPQSVTLTLPATVKQVSIAAPNGSYTMTNSSVVPIAGAVPLSVTDAPMVVSFHL